MLKLRDFKCSCGAVIEDLVKDDTKEIQCKCGKKAALKVSAARYYDNTVGSSPSLKR